MKKKLSAHGNSKCLVIEKPILDLLGWEPGTEIKIETDGKRLVLSRAYEPPDLAGNARKAIETRRRAEKMFQEVQQRTMTCKQCGCEHHVGTMCPHCFRIMNPTGVI